MTEQELTELFRKLGAANPEGWAHSQMAEGIPQLARYLFLRQAWRKIVGPDDQGWISEMREWDRNAPGGEIGPALGRLLAAGGQPEDLTAVVRVMQWRLLSAFCRLLEDPGDVEEDVADIGWQLFQLDENDRPTAEIHSLIESVLETDPTGREMRPPQ